jgi:DNA polymerase-3 subunit beta
MTIEFTTTTATFSTALAAAERFADKRSTQPALANVLLQASDQVVLSATDLMISLTQPIVADVRSRGSLMVSAAHLAKVVKTLPSGELRFRGLDNHWAEIVAGKNAFKLMGMPETDFPALPDPAKDGKKAVTFSTITGRVLADLIQRTGFSVSTDEARVNLNGVLLESDGTTATMVSTDGHRLTKYARPMEGLVLDKGIIIPRKGMLELQRVLDRHPGEVEIGVGRDFLFLRVDQQQMAVKLNNVAFPPYKQVIPTSVIRSVQVDRLELLGALRRTEVMAPEKTATVRLQIDADSITLTADNPDLGVAHHEIDATLDGKPMEAGFNARYIMAALEALDVDALLLEFQNDLDPMVIKASGDGIDFTGVVMPMRV